MRLAEKYLTKTPKQLFWLGFLGVPVIIWMYAVVSKFNASFIEEKRINSTLIKVLFISPLFLAVLNLVFFDYFTNKLIFVATVLMFLIYIVTAYSIIKYEKLNHLKVSNLMPLFLGIWFFPIGIWQIQPKLNQYVKLHENKGVK